MLTLQNQSPVPEASKSVLTDTRTHQLLREWQSCPKSSGKTQYLRYLQGEKLTYMQAVLAKCAECNCGYDNGRRDCEIPICPLYPFMPYRGKSMDEWAEPEQ